MSLAFKNKVVDALRSQVLRNIGKLLSGAVLAQAITIIATPVITRLYGPDAVGAQGVFASIVSITSVLFAFGYPYAVVIPKQHMEARDITALSLLSGLVLLVASTVFVWALEDQLVALLNAPKLRGDILLVPLASFAACLSITTNQWLARLGKYGVSAQSLATASLTSNAIKAGGGIIYPSSVVLIAGYTSNYLLNAALGTIHLKPSLRCLRRTNLRPLLGVAAKYWDFALLRTPQALISACSLGLPVILLSKFFGTGSAGYYSLALSILFLPVNLFGSALNSVLYPKVNEIVQSRGDAAGTIRSATRVAFALAIPAYGCGAVLAPWAFPMIFGAKWTSSGEYAQVIAPMLLLQFSTRPVIAAIPALRLQGMLLKHELITTIVRASSLWVGFEFFTDPLIAVALFSITSSIMYLALIYFVMKSIKSNSE